MRSETDVAVLVGSLRHESFSRKVAKAAAAIAPASLRLAIVEIGNLSLYNEDDDTDTPPASWRSFRKRIHAAGAVLFVTPEYNRSVPGVLKNAVDIGSRPYGHSVWDGKPAAIISVSTGALGGFGANHHLPQSLVFVNMPAMQQPEAYIGAASTLFDQDGLLASDSTVDYLRHFLDAFSSWIESVKRP
jgi:chromate reductase, NAD(P)H dehydrogenase (quinone)